MSYGVPSGWKFVPAPAGWHIICTEMDTPTSEPLTYVTDLAGWLVDDDGEEQTFSPAVSDGDGEICLAVGTAWEDTTAGCVVGPSVDVSGVLRIDRSVAEAIAETVRRARTLVVIREQRELRELRKAKEASK